MSLRVVSGITSNPFFYNACFPRHIRQAREDIATLQQGAADVNKGAFEGAESEPTWFHRIPSQHTRLLPGNQLLDWGEGRRWYSISGLWITVPCSVFFLWWFGWLSNWEGAQRRNVLRSWPQHWGTDLETGTEGCCAITWPRGCLFKPKSCLDYCPQTLLLYCSCMRHKGRELEMGRAKKGSLREEVWTMSSLVLRKRH